MGCSPSKGQAFAGIYNHQDKALQFGSCESNSHHVSGETELKSQTETDIVSSGLILLPKESTAEPLQGKRTTVCDIVTGNDDVTETNVDSPEELLTEEIADGSNGRRMKNNECKKNRPRERKTVFVQSKLDPPQSMVKAHQGVYDYLKHNIPKYESLLDLLEKAKQTQLSLQIMVSLLASHYEEINQALDEIATEGEKMLKMHGNYMVLPATQNDVLPNSDIPEAETNSSSSDLLQHTLRQLMKKMRIIGDSVTGLGDTSLEETGDYFSSLSQSLSGKLGEKRATELRLKQVLACVKLYVLGDLSLEDSALPSEDSGIGVENESHSGSVRRCSHQESSGSRSSYDCPVQPSEDEDDDVDKDTDAEDSNDDEESKHEQRSKSDLTNRNRSQADNRQYSLQVNLQYKMPNNSTSKWSDHKERNIIRPQTADDSSISCQRKHGRSHSWHIQRSRSADCLYKRVNDYMIQGHNRLLNDNQKPEWIKKRWIGLRSQFYCLQDGNIGSFKPRLTPSMTPTFEPVPPGKNAVRRLINTFSQGGCDNQSPLTGPTRFKRRKRTIFPIISRKTDVSTSSNSCYTLNQQLSERHDEDVSSLPPPPPELLMDNSFEKNEVPAGEEENNETQNQRCVTQRQKCCVSECPQVSMQREHSLCSQDSSAGGSLNISETCHKGQDFVDDSDPEQDNDKPIGDKDKKKDEATDFFQHSQKIVHLWHSTDSSASFGSCNEGNIKSSYEVVGGTVRQENRDSGKRELSTLYANNHPPTTPPVSRARIPPSNYSTCPKVPRPIDLPPIPTCQVNDQQEISRAPFTYQIQRSDRKNCDEGNDFITPSSSMSFYAARSVFCQSAFQSAKPSCRSTLPRPWGEPKVSRGRLQATCLSQTITRSTLDRPTFTDHQSLFCSVTEPHYQDNDATILNNEREEYTAETAQCSKQEIPVICSVSGSQEAEAKITDRKD